MRIDELMTQRIQSCRPEDSLQRAARPSGVRPAFIASGRKGARRPSAPEIRSRE